jgi:hypothetical protein
MTRAVDTMIQAVSPEFKPSEANAEEKGKMQRIAAAIKHLNFIFKLSPPLGISNGIIPYLHHLTNQLINSICN